MVGASVVCARRASALWFNVTESVHRLWHLFFETRSTLRVTIACCTSSVVQNSQVCLYLGESDQAISSWRLTSGIIAKHTQA